MQFENHSGVREQIKAEFTERILLDNEENLLIKYFGFIDFFW